MSLSLDQIHERLGAVRERIAADPQPWHRTIKECAKLAGFAQRNVESHQRWMERGVAPDIDTSARMLADAALRNAEGFLLDAEKLTDWIVKVPPAHRASGHQRPDYIQMRTLNTCIDAAMRDAEQSVAAGVLEIAEGGHGSEFFHRHRYDHPEKMARLRRAYTRVLAEERKRLRDTRTHARAFRLKVGSR